MALSIKTLHTHTHTHTHTHVHTHTHRYTHTQMCAHRHTRTCTHTETHAHTHKPTCTHTETLTYAHPHRHTHAHTHTHTHTHTCTCTHTDTHTYAHTHRHTCTCTCTHTHRQTHMRMRVHTHTHNLEYNNRSLYCSYFSFILSSFSMARTKSNSSTTRSSTCTSARVSHQKPQSLSSHFLEANSCQARRHDWNPPTERRSQVLCLKKAACFISDLLGWNLKRKTEEWLGILNGHLITLATVQGRRCSKKDGRQDANQGVWYLWLSSWINEIQYLSRRKG